MKTHPMQKGSAPSEGQHVIFPLFLHLLLQLPALPVPPSPHTPHLHFIFSSISTSISSFHITALLLFRHLLLWQPFSFGVDGNRGVTEKWSTGQSECDSAGGWRCLDSCPGFNTQAWTLVSRHCVPGATEASGFQTGPVSERSRGQPAEMFPSGADGPAGETSEVIPRCAASHFALGGSHSLMHPLQSLFFSGMTGWMACRSVSRSTILVQMEIFSRSCSPEDESLWLWGSSDFSSSSSKRFTLVMFWLKYLNNYWTSLLQFCNFQSFSFSFDFLFVQFSSINQILKQQVKQVC